jgi:hypothetical protein
LFEARGSLRLVLIGKVVGLTGQRESTILLGLFETFPSYNGFMFASAVPQDEVEWEGR